MQTAFFDQFMGQLPPESLVVDLGAGEGKYSQALAAAGHQVIAVDKKAPELSNLGTVEYHTMTVDMWLDGLAADFTAGGYLLKNILQFLPKDWVLDHLLPTLMQHTQKGGVIAIETFTQAPNPPFEHTHRSYYSISELRTVFADWEILLAEESENDGPDMHGTQRHFYMTSIIARKS